MVVPAAEEASVIVWLKPWLFVAEELVDFKAVMLSSGAWKTRSAFLARTPSGARAAMRRKGRRKSSWSEANKRDEALVLEILMQIKFVIL